ncbi:hypothetical protein PIB30_056761 [Stylosanthes scabra]|uniref:Uncharacterized protein n=1 Tax=Stylosanthes scabra TaxID=79078 RepID=A0ABU6UJA4_9FABA|nr:hypothetical protein [Stylosanthes scabra]
MRDTNRWKRRMRRSEGERLVHLQTWLRCYNRPFILVNALVVAIAIFRIGFTDNIRPWAQHHNRVNTLLHSVLKVHVETHPRGFLHVDISMEGLVYEFLSEAALKQLIEGSKLH